MKERWIEYAKKADFNLWAEKLNVSPLVARVIRNRNVETLEEAEKYLYGEKEDLFNPHTMKGLDEAVTLLTIAIRLNQKIAIVSDFDDDGIFAGEILYEGILACNGQAEIFTPNRMTDGYGINERIVDEAGKKNCSVILTCDNGIAAHSAISYAKSQGFTVIVTDHHEVQYELVNDEKKYILPDADAIVDPKQEGDSYAFKELCGAGVAFKLITVLYEIFEIPESKLEDLYQYVAIATVADVVPLVSENRILVKLGLLKLNYTRHLGLSALLRECELEEGEISSYSIGFVIGPCFNAVGRLSDAKLAYELLQAENEEDAVAIAKVMHDMNKERQDKTEEGLIKALDFIAANKMEEDPVIVVNIENIHESVVGIIAGKIKEKFNRPTYVFTNTENGLKGSGRSIEGYSMIDELMKVKHLTEKAGGHMMAAGVSLLPEKFQEFRKTLISNCPLKGADFDKKVMIDARMPLSYISETLIQELSLLEPFGTMNSSPIFARPHFKIHLMRLIGRNKNYISMTVSDESNVKRSAVMFDQAESFLNDLREKFGDEEVEKAFHGSANRLDAALSYYPNIREYNGEKSVQIVVKSYLFL